MKIGIDARRILNPDKNPQIGIGHYTYQLIQNLLRIDKENQYELFFDHRARKKDIKRFKQKNVKISYFPWSDYKKYLPGAYSEILGLATFSGKKLDILHITCPDFRVPLAYRGKVICTFQDLEVFKFPKHFPRFERVKKRYNQKVMIRRADSIIVASESVKNDLKEVLNVPESKIEIIKNGIMEEMLKIERKKYSDCSSDLKKEFKINKRFILFVGTLEPSKNIVRLFQAFRLLKSSYTDKGKNFPYQLVMAGKSGWLADEFVQVAKDLDIWEDVRFLGYVERDRLKILMSCAEFFVMPSLHEGFGMTVLEAMAAKMPILLSDISVLQELATSKVEFFDPLDINELFELMKKMTQKKKKKVIHFKDVSVFKSLYSWESCAKKTLDLYKQIAKS